MRKYTFEKQGMQKTQSNILFLKNPAHQIAENISPTKQSQGSASALPFNT